MGIKQITINENDIKKIFEEAEISLPASFTGDACDAYRNNRHIVHAAAILLQAQYPQMAHGIAMMMVIIEKICSEENKQQ